MWPSFKPPVLAFTSGSAGVIDKHFGVNVYNLNCFSVTLVCHYCRARNRNSQTFMCIAEFAHRICSSVFSFFCFTCWPVLSVVWLQVTVRDFARNVSVCLFACIMNGLHVTVRDFATNVSVCLRACIMNGLDVMIRDLVTNVPVCLRAWRAYPCAATSHHIFPRLLCLLLCF